MTRAGHGSLRASIACGNDKVHTKWLINDCVGREKATFMSALGRWPMPEMGVRGGPVLESSAWRKFVCQS